MSSADENGEVRYSKWQLALSMKVWALHLGNSSHYFDFALGWAA